MILVLLLGLCARQASVPIDLTHDLGFEVGPVVERVEPVPRKVLARVAEAVGGKPEDLAGVRLFQGSYAIPEEPPVSCHYVVMPLGAPLQGGRAVFAVFDGRAHAMGLWGALDFDEDPSLRWTAFIGQLRESSVNESGAPVGPVALADASAAELEARERLLASARDGRARLEGVLLRQRLAMRENGIMLALTRRGRPEPAWYAALANDMERLAEDAPGLAPILGEAGTRRYGELARELAGLYRERAGLPDGADARGFRERMLASCRACHESEVDGTRWRELHTAARAEVDLVTTRLRVGFDVAPAPGDDGRASAEIARKVKAGILLVEALAP